MEYIDELTLVMVETEMDEIGNVVQKETTKDILCKPNKVGTREFYNALAVGLKPTAELQIKVSNYSGEQEVIYKGQRLSVIRTVPRDKFDIVLVIGKKEGVNGISHWSSI